MQIHRPITDDPTKCPTCGGPADHGPLAWEAEPFYMPGESTPIPTTIHHDGPAFVRPSVIYLKITADGKRYTPAELVAAAQATLSGMPWAVASSDDRFGTFSDETPRVSIDCGCTDLEEHREGVDLQTKMRKQGGIPRAACVGCYIGDDGLAIHSCVIHDARYWPKETD